MKYLWRQGKAPAGLIASGCLCDSSNEQYKQYLFCQARNTSASGDAQWRHARDHFDGRCFDMSGFRFLCKIIKTVL